MRDNIIFGFIVVAVGVVIYGLLSSMSNKQKEHCELNTGNHTFLVYYTPVPDTLRLFGSYELTSYRGTNDIYERTCGKLSPKCILSTTAPIKHIFNK